LRPEGARTGMGLLGMGGAATANEPAPHQPGSGSDVTSPAGPGAEAQPN